MKKPGSNQRSPNRSDNQRRNNSKIPRNNQRKNNQNRNANNERKSHTAHLWASSSSATLTSHLSIIDKRNQTGASKSINGKNGTGISNGKPGGKLNYVQNGKNRKRGQGRLKKNQRGNQSDATHQNRPHGDSRSAPIELTQQNKFKYNKKLVSKTNTSGVDPFELFCAYHLGISPTNQYRPANINEVANRFKLDTVTTRQILKEYGMDSASLLDRDFDMAMAQLDIQVAPEGVNRTELARNIFEDFLEAPVKRRDWEKILEEDKKENAKTFSRR